MFARLSRGGTATSSSSDATTPKAVTHSNPFDTLSFPPPSPTRSTSYKTTSHRSGDATPMPPTPGGGLQPPQPTTQLTLEPPEFTLKSHPPSKSKPSASVDSVPATSSSPTSAQPIQKSSTGAPRGQLHVKLIQARGLNIKSSRSRPYVVVVYEQNEFVSREPIHESEKEVRGVPAPLSRQNSSSALAALNGIQKAFDIKPKQHQPSTSAGSSSRSSSGSSGGSKVTNTNPSQTLSVFGHNISAKNPTWKHEVSFDVTSNHSVLSLNIYDREYENVDGYLGTVEITPALVHDRAVDVWHKLESNDVNHPVTGELRVQITYEQSKSKRSLTPRDFEVLKLVGKGTFGRVFQVRKKDTKRIYAMKVLSKKEIIAKKEVAHTIGERKILQRSLESPFLVGLKFSFQTDHELFLVTDFKSGGELFWHLQRETRFSEERARFYIAELTLALEHLHKHDIVYRDLKPENILLDATGHVALCDFGLSKPDLASNQLTNTFCGTTEYLAPEILLDDLGYSKMVDFWSLGVLLFEMLCGWSPFYDEDTQVMYRNICYGKIKFPRNTVGEDGKQFVKGLLNRVPANRLGSKRDAAELKEHAFFKMIDWEALSKKEVTPPFKPNVESDDSTANFDSEFTSVDLKDAGVDEFDDSFDEDDPSDSWIPESHGQRTFNGPAGSDKIVANHHAPGEFGAEGVKVGSAPKAINTGVIKKPQKSRRHSPISSSIQENFRGFSYTASESVDEWAHGGLLSRRLREEEAKEKLRQSAIGEVDDEWDGQRISNKSTNPYVAF